MASPRRPRGSVINPTPVGYRVQRAALDRVSAWAARADVSKAEMLEFIIWQVEETSTGLPATWPGKQNPQELPIDAL